LRRDCRAHLIDSDTAVRKRAGIELHANRVLLTAENLHLRDARDHRDPLRHERLAVLVQLGELQRA